MPPGKIAGSPNVCGLPLEYVGPKSRSSGRPRPDSVVDAIVADRDREVDVRLEVDLLRHEPVQVGEVGDRREPDDLQVQRAGAEGREVVDRAQLELLVLRRVVATDDLDLEVAARAD